MNKDEDKKTNRIIQLGQNLFAKFFGFENGIDITDDVAVLNRRNIVIKNIIFVSNLFYSFLLLVLSIATKRPSDLAITLVSFPMTFLVNRLLTTLITTDKTEKIKQFIAAYVASFYIFLSSVIIYARLYNTPFETVSYVLIYYSIVVISLYQDKKLLRTAFLYLFVLVTLIHIIWTYEIPAIATGLSIIDFIKTFIGTDAFGDLLLRSLVFTLFYLVVYVIVSIGQYMQDERRKELVKRRQVQNDFANIVGSLFKAVFVNDYLFVNKEHALQVQRISYKVAEDNGLSNFDLSSLSTFSIVHLRYEEVKDFVVSSHVYDEDTYNIIKTKTTLGADIIRRIELAQTADAIVRAYTENTITPERMQQIMEAQSDLDSQIIILSDIYLTLRSAKSYKRPYTHSVSVSLIDTQIGPFFIKDLKERFLKFSDELEDLYNKF